MKNSSNSPKVGRGRISEFLEREVIPRLEPERVFDHPAHDWKRKTQKELVGGCPFHESKSRTAFKVRIRDLSWFCFSCNFGGGPVQYLSRLHGVHASLRGDEWLRFAQQLAGLAGLELPASAWTEEDRRHFRQLEVRRSILEVCNVHFQENLWSEAGAAARRYLVEVRKFTEDNIRELSFGLYLSPDLVAAELRRTDHDLDFAGECGVLGEHWKDYITLPWLDEHGNLINFCGRYAAPTPPEGRPKVLGLPGEQSKRCPLFLDRALQADHQELTVVEGILDACMAQAFGDTSCAGCIGFQVTRDQAETLSRCGIRRVTLCLDPDGAGDDGTRRSIPILEEAGIEVRVAPRLPEGIDPDEFLVQNGIEVWKKHLTAAVEGSRYLVAQLVRKHRPSESWTEDARAAFLRDAVSEGLGPAGARSMLEELTTIPPEEVLTVVLNSVTLLRCFALLQVHDRAGYERVFAALRKGGVKAGHLKAIASASKPLAVDVEELQEDEGSERPNIAVQLVELVLEHKVELFHDPHGTAFASRPEGDHVVTTRLRERALTSWLRHLFFIRTGRAASTNAVNDAIGILEGMALQGPQEMVHVRIAAHGDAIYLDLGSASFAVVEIGPSGWRIVKSAPVRFRRPPGIQPLPEPARGGRIEELRPLLNCTDEQWVLVLGWLVASFRPVGPYPVLVVLGEQGSAKTTCGRLARACIDPNSAQVRTLPRDARDLMIAAKNSWVLFFDNLSRLTPWISDALCRLSTGGGFSTRALYTDDEEAIFDSQRPILLTGIEEVVERADLLDRAIILHLRSIPEEKRRTEAAILIDFQAVAGGVFGALLDVVVTGLRNLSKTVLDRSPRMADFARWVVACEPALGVDSGAFLRAYQENRQEIEDLALEVSPVATLVRQMIEEQEDPFEGTAAELGERLRQYFKSGPPEGWPKTPKGLSDALRRAGPGLRAVGIEISHRRQPGGKRKRLIAIRRSGTTVPTVPNVPEDPGDATFPGQNGTEAPEGGTQGDSDHPSRCVPPPAGETGSRDDSTGSLSTPPPRSGAAEPRTEHGKESAGEVSCPDLRQGSLTPTIENSAGSLEHEPPPPAGRQAMTETCSKVAPRDPKLEEAIHAIVDQRTPDPQLREVMRVSLEPWFEHFEERAAILEFEANLPHADAEDRARAMILAQIRADITSGVARGGSGACFSDDSAASSAVARDD